MLENLNAEQKNAVQTTEGPLLVLSGAGTGKTRVLTTRIAYILNMNLAQPWQIMALTFTNRAANEMKTRIAAFADSGASWYAGDLWCGTFHSICLRILRTNAIAAGLRRDFLIYGEDEQKAVLKSVFSAMGLDTKDFNPSDWVERISGVKDKGLHERAAARAMADKILDAYNAELARLGAVDFGDIILKVLELFKNNPDILSRYQKQFKYILVDEFQDTNNAQMQFLTALTQDTQLPNICCVGDDDQSIYSWRGAEIKHILNFNKTYADAKIIRLETNYRSTANILGAANSLIRHNSGRLGKDLRSANSDNGEPVYVLTLPSDRDEARIIADSIIRKSDNEPFSNYAVLIRAGSLSRLFEEEFAQRGIPYKLVGTTKFYDRAEIRDVIAYLRLLVYPFDDLSFMRVIAKPRRGFGDVALEKLKQIGPNMMTALRTASLTAKQRVAADEFLSAFNFDWDSMAPMDAAQHLVDASGYIKMWRESKDPDAPERIEHIRELITNVISKYDTMSDFLEHAALMMTDDNDASDNAPNTDAVNIMTIHAAKGLEFDTVFLPAWEDGIFPNDKSINEGAIEEERRLAYVAITRAQRRAVISNAMCRSIFGERKYNSPSHFITEIDSRFLDFQGGAISSRPTYNAYTPRRTITPRAVQKTQSVVGKLCEHDELGRGVIIEENGDIITVAFRARGIKKVARSYLKIGL